MTDISVSCPKCGQSLEAPPDMAGETVQCPACDGPVTIPGTPVPREDNLCPGCGEALDKSDVICLKCGTNRTTGKKHQTTISRTTSGPTLPASVQHTETRLERGKKPPPRNANIPMGLLGAFFGGVLATAAWYGALRSSGCSLWFVAPLAGVITGYSARLPARRPHWAPGIGAALAAIAALLIGGAAFNSPEGLAIPELEIYVIQRAGKIYDQDQWAEKYGHEKIEEESRTAELLAESKSRAEFVKKYEDWWQERTLGTLTEAMGWLLRAIAIAAAYSIAASSTVHGKTH